MKKLMICGILAVAVAGAGFAQWPDGLSFSGEFKTGFRTDFFGGAYGDNSTQLAGDDGKSVSSNLPGVGNNDGLIPNGTYVENVSDRAVTSIWNDDAGNRFRLGFNYTQPVERNFGFRGYVNFNFGSGSSTKTADLPYVEDPTSPGTNLFDGVGLEYSVNNSMVALDSAWGWFNILNGLVQVSVGWVDDGRWASPSPEDISFSNPKGGFRIEAKPIDGLSVGWVVRNDGNGVNGNNNGVFGGQSDYNPTLKNFFGSSAFGASYEMPSFLKVAAGLELRPDGNGRRGKGFGFGGPGDPMNSMATLQGIDFAGMLADPDYGTPNFDISQYLGTVHGFGGGDVEAGDLGVSAYFGAQVQPIDPLTVQLGFVVANMDKIGKKDDKPGSAYLHANQKVAYSVTNDLTARVTAHEVFDMSGDDSYFSTNDTFDVNKTEGSNYPIYLEFVPGVDYTLSDNLSGYLEVGLKLYGELFEIAPKPGVTFTFGPGYELGAYYQLFLDGNTANIYKDAKASIRNVVQVNFGWSF